MTQLFLDCEFTGLVKEAELISLCLYLDDNNYFYAELNDFKRDQLSKWHCENVITKLLFEASKEITEHTGNVIRIKADKTKVTEKIKEWLDKFENIEVWGDVPAYDWVLFCDLFGGATHLPQNIFYIQFDLATLAKIKGIDPDFKRFDFVKAELLDIERESQHSALIDAKALKISFNKINEQKNTPNMTAQKLFERLQQYRVDFAYSKNLYYAASKRLKNDFQKKDRLSRNLNIAAVVLSILVITNLMLYLEEIMGKNAVYIASLVALASIVITLYIFFFKNPERHLEYYQRGNEYLALYKQAKDLEAKYLDTLISGEQLSSEVEKLHQGQQKLNANLLPTEEIDYLEAKKGITEGQTGYTPEEIEKA